jgi:type II secretory pathway pseudopilin PulG
MATSATGNRKRAPGSTLIELLVSMAIASVMLGAATLAFPRSDARRADQAVARAQALVELACERAELGGRDIGIVVERQRIAFASLQDGGWQPIVDSPQEALRPRMLDKVVTLALRVDAPLPLPSQPETAVQVACMASGELTPFTLDLSGPGRQRRSLHGDGSGGVRQVRDDAR